jgi:hypothetical protein
MRFAGPYASLFSSLSFVVPSRFILFKHALGGLDGCDNNYRHSTQQSNEEEVLKHRQKMMDQEIHKHSL